METKNHSKNGCKRIAILFQKSLKMKRNLLIITVVIMVLSSCAPDKKQLIAKKWICEKVVGTGDNLEKHVEEKVNSGQSVLTKDLKDFWSFIGNLEERVRMNKNIPAKWVFDKNGAVAAIKVWNDFGRAVENLNWKLDENTLTIYGTNSDKHDISFYLTIETINNKEMILTKDFFGRTIRIYYSADTY
jgi:hypothetical protein